MPTMKLKRDVTELAQKGCLLEGVTELLSRTPGDFTVLLHSDPDCANLVSRDFYAVDPGRFLCTNLGEGDVITGRSSSRLREALKEIVRAGKKGAVFVIGSCVSSLVAEDIEGIVGTIKVPTGMRIATLPADAFRMCGQAEVIDLYTGLMSEASAGPIRPRERTVNMLGFPPDGGEAAAILESIGIRVNAAPQLYSRMEDWSGIGSGALNVVTDRRLFNRLLERLEAGGGAPCMEVAPPEGLAATEKMYTKVAAHFGVEKRAAAAVEAASGDPRKQLERFRRRFRGKRLAYHVGARKSFELETTVREGLLHAELFPEMGFEVELLFQGRVEEDARIGIAEVLDRYGLRMPFRMVKDRPSLVGVIKERKYDLIYCCDSLREEVEAGGIPMIPFGALSPGFKGLVRNISYIESILEGR